MVENPGSKTQDSAWEEAQVITLGCRLNAYESQVIARQARTAGLKRAVIINSCAVTAEAERQTRQEIRKAARRYPGVPVLVTGCAAQRFPERYHALPEVTRVLGNREKLEVESYRRAESLLVGDISAQPLPAPPVLEMKGRTRAILQVQQGCDHSCTFCLIPQARGGHRSLPFEEICRQLEALLAQGVKEVTLSGVDLASYGQDAPLPRERKSPKLPQTPTGAPPTGAPLAAMIAELLTAFPHLPRLRLSSVDPVAVGPELMALFAEQRRLMPHLHLSLQAGHDLILKRMKRRHRRKTLVDLCARLRELRPGIALGADMIAGFPTEDEEAFAASLAIIQDCGLAFVHVFPYSVRPGTPAARMPQVPFEVRKARARQLRAEGARCGAIFLDSCLHQQLEILMETENHGRAENYAIVRLPSGVSAHPGKLLPVSIIKRRGLELIGVPASSCPASSC